MRVETVDQLLIGVLALAAVEDVFGSHDSFSNGLQWDTSEVRPSAKLGFAPLTPKPPRPPRVRERKIRFSFAMRRQGRGLAPGHER